MFYLKNPENKKDIILFENAIKKLILNNPQGVKTHLGSPAKTKKRDVVENAYTFCYIMTFLSLEDQKKYQSHKTHLNFIDEGSHLWEKVIVYDSMQI